MHTCTAALFRYKSARSHEREMPGITGIKQGGTKVVSVPGPPPASEKSSLPPALNDSTGTKAEKKVPILMYHAAAEKPWGLELLFIRTPEFEKQIKYLCDNGYTPLTFDNLKHFEAYDKPVIITFDDGYRDNYHNAYPVLKKYNFKAVIFLIVNCLDTPAYLATSQVKEMSGIASCQKRKLRKLQASP